MKTEIINAQIHSTMLGFEDRGIFTYMITLSFGGSSCQGFGGYVLGEEYTTQVVKGILKTVGADTWEELKGKYVRFEKEAGYSGRIIRIGHLIEDKWFDPKNV